jgi:hypothetical protein
MNKVPAEQRQLTKGPCAARYNHHRIAVPANESQFVILSINAESMNDGIIQTVILS